MYPLEHFHLNDIVPVRALSQNSRENERAVPVIRQRCHYIYRMGEIKEVFLAPPGALGGVTV